MENVPIKREKLVLSVPEAAEVLGISNKTAYELVNRADFPAFRIKRRICVSYPGLVEWVRRQSGEKEV